MIEINLKFENEEDFNLFQKVYCVGYNLIRVNPFFVDIDKTEAKRITKSLMEQLSHQGSRLLVKI